MNYICFYHSPVMMVNCLRYMETKISKYNIFPLDSFKKRGKY